jgi:hypothetical protein
VAPGCLNLSRVDLFGELRHPFDISSFEGSKKELKQRID